MAVTTARMMGWKTRSFREKKFFHYRRSALLSVVCLRHCSPTARKTTTSEGIRSGRSAGSHTAPPKSHMSSAPRLWEQASSGLSCVKLKRPVSDELMRFHRKEQMAKLKVIVKSKMRFRRVDNFDVAAN